MTGTAPIQIPMVVSIGTERSARDTDQTIDAWASRRAGAGLIVAVAVTLITAEAARLAAAGPIRSAPANAAPAK
ncbi:MAG: hypothetical protein EHM91_00085 [Planctomycetota bacterium]|nr:MAG: hypothetical protein EHM91_00085 [Planctomycetota bacterium]